MDRMRWVESGNAWVLDTPEFRSWLHPEPEPAFIEPTESNVLVAEQDGVIIPRVAEARAAHRWVRGGQAHVQPQWDALDLVQGGEATAAPVSDLRSASERLRDGGATSYSTRARFDGDAAACLAALGELFTRLTDADIALPASRHLEEVLDDTEAARAVVTASTVSPWLGVNMPGFHTSDTARATHGPPWRALADLVRLGAGWTRQLADADLDLAQLLDTAGWTEPIPDPWELNALLLRTNLSNPRFEPMAWFTFAAAVAACYGIQLIPTLFAWGGGSAVNKKQSENPDDEIGSSEVTWRQAIRYTPLRQTGIVVPWEEGWSGWYWDEADRGSSQDLHRFALVLSCHDNPPQWQRNTDEGSRFVTPEESEEPALRKRLAVAAYADAVGQYLAALDDVFSAWGAEVLGREDYSLADVVPVLELGNEMDAYWMNDGSDLEYDYPSEEEREEARTTAAAVLPQQGAEEFGIYLAHLAAPLLRWWNRARFRAAEVVTAQDEPGTVRNLWLRTAVLEGIASAISAWEDGAGLWGQWVGGYFLPYDFQWPPNDPAWVPPSPQDLCHEAGLHYYHFSQTGKGEPYHDTRTLVGALRTFLEEVVDPIRATWQTAFAANVSETGEPAERPLDPDAYPEGESSEGNIHRTQWNGSLALQGGSLYARLLAPWILGFARVGHHNHMEMVKDRDTATDWNTQWFAMGLRNDVFVSDDGSINFLQGSHAWARPAWWAFQRLSRLLNATAEGSLEVTDADGAQIHLVRGDDPEGVYRGHADLHIVWVDPTRQTWENETRIHVSVDPDKSRDTTEILPLVPRITPSPDYAASSQDSLGYAVLDPDDDAWWYDLEAQQDPNGHVVLEPRPRLAWDLMADRDPSEAEAAGPFGWSDPEKERFSVPLGLLGDGELEAALTCRDRLVETEEEEPRHHESVLPDSRPDPTEHAARPDHRKSATPHKHEPHA